VFGSYLQRLRIWETNFGRDDGWLVERNGQPIAILTQPRYEEMFWESYRLDVVAKDSDLRQLMETQEFWKTATDLTFRSRKFGTVATSAFPSLTPLSEHGRLTMRGLHLFIGNPWPWDKVVLWLRRCQRSSVS
jgi:hypothetical protein